MRALTRRRFLQVAAAGGAAAALPWLDGCGGGSTHGRALRTPTPLPGPQHYFTADERALVERFAGALLPEGDGVAGAATAEVAEYIDRYLASFATETPAIYRGGPYSGRWPFPDPDSGDPSDDYPHNAFEDALPLTRMQELAFRIELDGSSAVPNGDINAPLVPSSPGLRAVYRSTLSSFADSVDALVAMNDEEVLDVFAQTPTEFQTAFAAHLGEGMFCAPEYGGNAGGVAWRDYQYDGDSQPLGHTLYDADGTPRDRPDQPNQSEDSNRPPHAFSPMVDQFITAITVAQGGTKFF